MSDEIKQIKDTAGAYKRWALEARKAYIDLRLRQDIDIRKLYIKAADKIAAEIMSMVANTPSARFKKYQLEQLEILLRAEADAFINEFTSKMEQYIENAVSAGAVYSTSITMDLLTKAKMDTTGMKTVYFKVNSQAVEACWARTKNGLMLSKRIWQQGERFKTTITDIVQAGVATGTDAAKVAKALERYVKTDSKTLAKQYPNMMDRMGNRVPGNISYEALRLARTEMTAAFGEGSILAARVSPSYTGMKWVLSKSHPVNDICDTYAAHEEGLGKGVYGPNNEPPYPGHPNCLCILLPQHQQPSEFLSRLKAWKENPKTDNNLEDWYQNIYKKGLVA